MDVFHSPILKWFSFNTNRLQPVYLLQCEFGSVQPPGQPYLITSYMNHDEWN